MAHTEVVSWEILAVAELGGEDCVVVGVRGLPNDNSGGVTIYSFPESKTAHLFFGLRDGVDKREAVMLETEVKNEEYYSHWQGTSTSCVWPAFEFAKDHQFFRGHVAKKRAQPVVTDHACTCDMQTLMCAGCQCGGK